MKFVDARCPNCGGQVKFIQGNTLAKCEMCGSELQVEAEIKHRVQRAFDLISQKKWLAAESILNETLLLDSKNGQLYLGLLLCDLALCDTRLLAHAKCDYSNNPNFLRAERFLDLASRTELETLCSMNQQSLALKVETPKFEKTKRMKAFEEANLIKGKPGTPSTTMVGCLVDREFFKRGCEKKVVKFVQKTSSKWDKLMDLNADLSEEEKNNLEYYDEVMVERAFGMYKAIKQFMIKNEICDSLGVFSDEFDFDEIEYSGIFEDISRKIKVSIKERHIEKEDLSRTDIMGLIDKIDRYNSDFLGCMSKMNLIRLETAVKELRSRERTIPLTKRFAFLSYAPSLGGLVEKYRTVLPLGPSGKEAAEAISHFLMTSLSLLSRSFSE